MLKIAYISPIYFSDVDISYLQSLRQYAEVYYFIPLGPSTKGAAINIDQLYPHTGIFPASIYPELCQLGSLIDLDKTFVINRYSKDGRSYHNIILYHKLSHLLKKLNIDIVHCTEYYSYYEFPLYQWKDRTILSVHDPFVHSCVTSRRYDMRRKIAFRLLNHFVLFNENQRQDFIKTYMTNNKHVYSSHLSAYTYLRHHISDSTIPSKKKYILFFGQITSHKGIDDLLIAMKEVYITNPDIYLIIAGNGKFPMDISAFKNESYIEFRHRFIPEPELAELIANCEFVICPYKDATQSGVVMSAYAFNKPVIATRVGGLPEMVKDGELGRIISPSNPTQLAVAIQQMWDNPEERRQMSQNISQTYTTGELSWDTIAQEMVNHIYSNILL